MTERLYYADPLGLTFTARVADHGTFGGKPSVVLDQSAFYPESGGQLADRGTLGGLRVVDVQVDEAGTVHHLLEGELPDVGTEVSGEVERERRRLHMALHTGQHLLSRALVDVAEAETVSSRLGENTCTIDVDRDALPEASLTRAEALVNSVIDADLPIRAFFPEAWELRALSLRRAPKVEDNVRVVAIGDFDVTPCGGTHCLSTAGVGLVHVTGLERYKGKMRVSFSAGARARGELFEESALMKALARELTASANEVPAAFEKLRRELASTRQALGEARAELADIKATELISRAKAMGDQHIVAVLDDADVAFLRAVAKRISAEPGLVALLAAQTDGGQRVIAARGPGSDFHCGNFLRKVAQALGGQGGGRPELAEGRVPAEADWIGEVVRGVTTGE